MVVGIAICFGCGRERSFDLIIRGGTVYDGSGGAPRRVDVAIDGDRIAALGDLSRARGRDEIDATGLAVAPGFINMLSWATTSLLVDGRSQSDIRQGVTLEVMGEGWSMGPLNEEMKRRLVAEQGDLRYDVSWTTLGEYLDHLERRGVSTNVASFVGAATLRIHEIGYENRPPTAAELGRMRQLAADAMREGALGIGSSLIYAPAFYADTDELIELCKVAARHGGMYITHMRSEGNRLLEGVDEVLRIAREAGIRAEIYHLKAAGRDNWSKLHDVIATLEAARRDGLRITANMYTYTAGATGLDAAMPPWVQEGGLQAWIGRLRDPATRDRVEREMTTPSDDWENLFLSSGADKMILVGFKNETLKPLTGKTLAEVATERGWTPARTAIELVIEDGSRVGTVYFLMSEENIRRKLALPWVSFGSDEASMAPEGDFVKSGCHPRAYGNFARLLGRYVRDEKIVPLEEAVRRLTSLPASNLGIVERGRLAPGYFADVAVFDADTIIDHATFQEPHRYATGMHHVVVNGVPVLRDGEHTGATPGRVVRGPGYDRRVSSISFGSAAQGIDPSWRQGETNPAGRRGRWVVESASTVRIEARNKGQGYNLLLSADRYPADLRISVDVQAVSGEEDRGGGIVWRAVDENNYYVARWNPLEDNVRFYKVVDGVRTQLSGAELSVAPAEPHRLSVEATGETVRVSLDGSELVTASDATFGGPGRCGLWTKADASTRFAHLEIDGRE